MSKFSSNELSISVNLLDQDEIIVLLPGERNPHIRTTAVFVCSKLVAWRRFCPHRSHIAHNSILSAYKYIIPSALEVKLIHSHPNRTYIDRALGVSLRQTNAVTCIIDVQASPGSL
jgi:hypothetical protein